MRQVNKARKPVKARGRTGRTPSRGITRGPARQPFGRRAKFRNDPLSRLVRFFRGLLDARRPVFWLTAAMVLLTGIAVLFASGIVGRTVHRTDAAVQGLIAGAGFGVAQVHLAGNAHTPAVTIMAALGFTKGEPIFDIDLRAARARLMRLPWVKEAEVKRRYPDDVSVTIVERVPFARWRSKRGLYVVERDGRPITANGAGAFINLPLIVGQGAPAKAARIIAAVERHRVILAHVVAYQYQSQRRWNLLLGDGIVVKLPEEHWRKQLSDLDRLIVRDHILDADIREIDMRSPTHYFVVERRTGLRKEHKTGSAI